MSSICYIVPGTGIGGGMIVILEHANRLRARGHDVFLLNVGTPGTFDWFPDNCVPVYQRDDSHPREVDVLVATGWETSYVALLLDIASKRKVYFVQSDESRFFPSDMLEGDLAWNSYFLPFEFVTEARWIRDWLSYQFNQPALHAPNGLNHEFIHESSSPIEPRNPDRLRVLIEGPICIEFKGADDAFRAVEGIDAEVWCVSSAGGLKPWYHCDRFFEAVPFLQMKDIYSSCDVLLKMSKVEGVFGPPLEMMACGGTAVTTRVTGYDEYIVEGWNALTVDVGDFQGARQCLQKLIAEPNLLQDLRSNGRKTAAKAAWEPTIDVLEDYYLLQTNQYQDRLNATPFERSSTELLARLVDELVVKNRLGTTQDVMEVLRGRSHSERVLAGKLQFSELRLQEEQARHANTTRILESVLTSKRYRLGSLVAEGQKNVVAKVKGVFRG